MHILQRTLGAKKKMFYDSKMLNKVLLRFTLRNDAPEGPYFPCVALTSPFTPIRPMPRHLNPNVTRALRRRVAGCLLACVAFLAVRPVLADPQGAAHDPQLERRVKAAFLYKFLGYADFPANAFVGDNAPLTIGVIGADDMAVELGQAVEGRLMNRRRIVVLPLHDNELATPVHLLFVGGHDPELVGRMLNQASGAMLVVTECDGGLQKGSAINFRVIGERVRFDVAPGAAERKGVRLSSRLLTVAHRGQRGGQP
jgi:hypothetical protein